MTCLPKGAVTFSAALWKCAASFMLVMAVVLLIWEAVQGDGQLALIAVGLLSFVAISLPFFVKTQFDPLEPIVLFSFSVLMGCTLRAGMLALSNAENYRIFALTDGMSSSDIAINAAWIPVSLVILSAGYICVSNKRFALERFPIVKNTRWSSSRLLVSMSVLVIISCTTTFVLVMYTGVEFSSLAALSQKRTGQTDTSAALNYGSLGYLRWGSDLAKFALFFFLAASLSSNQERRDRHLLRKVSYRILLIALCVLSVAWPVLSSSRTGVLEVAFGVIVVLTYLGLKGRSNRQKRKFMSLATLATVAAVIVLVVMGVWRQHENIGEIRDQSARQVILNNTVGSGNFVPIARTALIIDRMSRRSDWYLGQSYFNVIYAPVPRTVWHDKPDISMGPFVKGKLYDRPSSSSGYPPGLIGEAFINFGVLGLIVAPFLAGVFLRVFTNSVKPLLLEGNRNVVVIYALILWPIGFQLADLSFALVVVNTLMALIPAIVLLSFISINRRSQTTYRVGGTKNVQSARIQ